MSATTQHELALPPRPTPFQIEGQFEELQLAQIKTRPQIREMFDEPSLKALADSIHENGVVQPIIVRWDDQADGYVLVAGERRVRASVMVGLATIPAVIRNDLDDDGAAVVQIIENLQRANLAPIEIVRGVGLMVDKLGNRETARRLSMDPATVSRIANVRSLWAPARKLIEDGLLDSPEIAHELAKLASLDEGTARSLVQAFYTPRAHNPAAPTRKEIRSLIDMKRAAIEGTAERKAEQTQLEIDRDNQRGYDSTAGEAPTSGKRDTKPLDREEDTANDKGKQLDLGDHPQVDDKVIPPRPANPLRDWAVRESERIENRIAARVGLTADAQGLWESISGDEVHLRVWADFSIDENRYCANEAKLLFNLSLDNVLLTELDALVTPAAAATGNPAARQMQLVSQFLDECCEEVQGAAIKASWLHEAFVEWFGTEALTIQHFGNAMKLLGYETHRHKTGIRYVDLQPKGGAGE